MNAAEYEIFNSWNVDDTFSDTDAELKSTHQPSGTEIPQSISNGMPTSAKIAWITVYSMMVLTAFGGNTIVVWAVIAHRRMRTVTNYFLVNLSVADLMMALLNCLFNFITMLERNWMFGTFYCKLNNFIAYVTITTSVFTLTGISYERFQAIVQPMQPRFSKIFSLMMIGCFWFFGILLGSPCLLYSTVVTQVTKGETKSACVIQWPDGLPNVSKIDLIYQSVVIIITYLIPMMFMLYFYVVMGRILWGSSSIGELTQRQIASIKSKRKVVKMFIVVLVIFALCWLPYHAYFIYIHVDPTILYWPVVQHIYLGFYWLAMATAMVNPIIYYWMNARFRGFFKTAMCGWRKIFRRRLNRSETESSSFVAHLAHSGDRSRSDTSNCYDSRCAMYTRRWPSTGCHHQQRPTQRPRLSTPPTFRRCSEIHTSQLWNKCGGPHGRTNWPDDLYD